MNYIACITISTGNDVEKIYEYAVTLGRVWNLVHKHLMKNVIEINVYRETKHG